MILDMGLSLCFAFLNMPKHYTQNIQLRECLRFYNDFKYFQDQHKIKIENHHALD